jgi:pSer/pThr/pTyr-binding forkhead associated (FHA) protein
MKDEAVKIVRNFKLPPQSGTYYRLVCLTGRNKGLSYFLSSKRVVMGRSEAADIQVMDVKSSREHAELAKIGDKYVVTDLGSQNGILVNDLKVSQHQLSDGDKIVIGQTVYKFGVVVVAGEVPAVVPDNEEDEEDSDDVDQEEVAPAKPSGKNKRILILSIILLSVVFLLPEDDSNKNVKEERKKVVQENQSAQIEIIKMIEEQNKEEDKELKKKLDVYLHRGLREFREGNYFRAIEEFNLGLILSPNNGQATFYLNKTKQSLDDHIKSIFIKGKQEVEALKYGASIVSYCEIIRLLQEYPDDQRYKDAEKNIEYLEEQSGMDKGDYKCF